MKISKLELIAALLGVAFLAFTAGWFLHDLDAGRQMAYSAADAALPQETPVVLPAPTADGQEEKVNINTADKELLQTLSGIGEKKAQAIIDYRTEHGPFRYPEDLVEVSGIGESILGDILDRITTGEDSP